MVASAKPLLIFLSTAKAVTKSHRTVQPIPRVTEARHDVADIIEVLIKSRHHDRHIGITIGECTLHPSQSFWRSEQHDRGDISRTAIEHEFHRRDQGSARRQHRVQHENLASGEIGGDPLGVRGRHEGFLIAHHAEEPDLGGRDQTKHPVEHAQTGTQDRHDHGARLRQVHTGHGGHGRDDVEWPSAQAPRRLIGEEGDHLVDEVAESRRIRRLVPQDGQLMGKERVFHHKTAHGC